MQTNLRKPTVITTGDFDNFNCSIDRTRRNKSIFQSIDSFEKLKHEMFKADQILDQRKKNKEISLVSKTERQKLISELKKMPKKVFHFK